jgi:hypothetical protein
MSKTTVQETIDAIVAGTEFVRARCCDRVVGKDEIVNGLCLTCDYEYRTWATEFYERPSEREEYYITTS